jgi:hypothetical protein
MPARAASLHPQTAREGGNAEHENGEFENQSVTCDTVHP